ncbi:hypothetical protein [Helicobacter anatolicus]|uniref:hypothetical protein n=1 Tax=Helicobacter anatolicus TaxID=2905874 RepID=UPI001E309FC9|nr:hypothetical protein [Helicobacter anatolicus]MCE3038293.1 hypothetical protein [Helicobacter anatolicus]
MKNTEYEELALEVLDMLAVAMYFAGAKKEYTEKLIDIYIEEVEKIDNDKDYDQQAIIDLIQTIKRKNPKLFT